MNVSAIDLNPRQRANLAQAWPAAHQAMAFFDDLADEGSLDHGDGDVMDAPLWAVVKWYLYRIG